MILISFDKFVRPGAGRGFIWCQLIGTDSSAVTGLRKLVPLAEQENVTGQLASSCRDQAWRQSVES